MFAPNKMRKKTCDMALWMEFLLIRSHTLSFTHDPFHPEDVVPRHNMSFFIVFGANIPSLCSHESTYTFCCTPVTKIIILLKFCQDYISPFFS